MYSVDVDKEPEVASKFDIRSVPSLLIFHNGEVVERLRTADESTIRERLLSYVSE